MAILLIAILRLLESVSRGTWFFVDTAAKCSCGPTWQFVSQLFRTPADYDTSPLVLSEWKPLPEYSLNLWPSCFLTGCSSRRPIFWSGEGGFMWIPISTDVAIKTTWMHVETWQFRLHKYVPESTAHMHIQCVIWITKDQIKNRKEGKINLN